MKKILLALLILMLFPISVHAQENDAYVAVNGKFIEMEDDLIKIKNGRTFVKLKVISNELSDSVKWDKDKREIEISKGSFIINMKISDKNYKIGEKMMQMDTEPFIYKDRAYVPLRFIAEAFDEKVVWDKDNKVILIGEFKGVDNFKDGTTLNFDNLNVSLKGPKNLDDIFLYVKERNTDTINFYNKHDYEKLNRNYGLIFRLTKSKYPVSEIVPGIIYSYNDGYYIEASFSSDVEFIPTDLNSKKTYTEAFDTAIKMIKTYRPIK